MEENMILSQEELVELAALNKKFGYAHQEWVTVKKYTLKQYLTVEPRLKYVNQVVVIEVPLKQKEGTFLKWRLFIDGGSFLEYELPYNSDYDEGDELIPESMTFCIEKCLGKTHLYLTGTLK